MCCQKLLAGLGALAALMASVAQATIVPIETSRCDTSEFSAGSPRGIGYDATLDRLVIIDGLDRRAYSVDRDCNATSSFDLVALGAGNAQGIAIGPDGRYALAVPAGGLVYASDTGAALGSCDLTAAQVIAPTGIVYDPSRSAYAILDSARDELVLVGADVTDGTSCSVLSRTDVSALGVSDGSGLAYIADDMQLAVVDQQTAQVILLDAALQPVDDFETNLSFGAGVPVGITYVDTEQRFYVTDRDTGSSVQVDARGTITPRCNLSQITPGIRPEGLALDSARAQLLVANSETNEVLVLDAASCSLLDVLPVSGLGLSSVAGVAFDPATDRIVLVDRDLLQLVFLDRTSLAITTRCPLGPGGPNPGPVTRIDPYGWFAVAYSEEVIAVFDRGCRLIERNSTGILDISSPSALLYGPLGEMLVFDVSSQRTQYTSVEGALSTLSFQNSSIGLQTPDGALALPDSRGHYLVVGFTPFPDWTIYDLKIPLYADPISLNGTFDNGTLTLGLIQRLNNTVSGQLRSATQATTVTGFVDAEAATIVLTLRPFGGGNVITVEGTYTPDFEALNLGAPFGQMERQP